LFHHLGRIDNQIKVLGQRVELEEIEAHLRAISGSENVAAIPWPIQDGIVKGKDGLHGTFA
jgi:acyl-coenzyme A synthetase/AMP-(fatty) acid ligase